MKYFNLYYTTRKKEMIRQQEDNGQAYHITGATDYYFSNPIVAVLVKRFLNNSDNVFKYNIQQIPQAVINNKVHIETFDDFISYIKNNSMDNEDNTKQSI
jgi:hypothetical protein